MSVCVEARVDGGTAPSASSLPEGIRKQRVRERNKSRMQDGANAEACRSGSDSGVSLVTAFLGTETYAAGEHGGRTTMQQLLEITLDGDIIGDDGEVQPIFSHDPEATEDPFD